MAKKKTSAPLKNDFAVAVSAYSLRETNN